MTFHENRNDNLVKVIQDFKKIQFPNNLLAYQTPLNKMFEALEILEGSGTTLDSILPLLF